MSGLLRDSLNAVTPGSSNCTRCVGPSFRLEVVSKLSKRDHQAGDLQEGQEHVGLTPVSDPVNKLVISAPRHLSANSGSTAASTTGSIVPLADGPQLHARERLYTQTPLPRLLYLYPATRGLLKIDCRVPHRRDRVKLFGSSGKSHLLKQPCGWPALEILIQSI
jgi:hypothetical protein